MDITHDTPLADLATRLPGAARVLERHRLDFCCRGHRSLETACAERALDPAAVAAEILAAAPPPDAVRWDEAPLHAVVEHIVERYHARLRDDLPRLAEMAAKVERVHAEKASCPVGLAKHLAIMESAVQEHLDKEERILFPMILAGRGAQAQMPIRVMLQEHEDHGESLARTRALTADLVAPPEACATWRALYLGLTELETDLHAHIHLENYVLFPRALRA
jgi:regulator of cell morphogenesis and NO signaling